LRASALVGEGESAMFLNLRDGHSPATAFSPVTG
jgi:hypothetical protein